MANPEEEASYEHAVVWGHTKHQRTAQNCNFFRIFPREQTFFTSQLLPHIPLLSGANHDSIPSFSPSGAYTTTAEKYNWECLSWIM